MADRPFHSHQSGSSSCRVPLPSNHHALSPLASSPQSVSSPPVVVSSCLYLLRVLLYLTRNQSHSLHNEFSLTFLFFPAQSSSHPPSHPSSPADSTTFKHGVCSGISLRSRYFSIPNFNWPSSFECLYTRPRQCRSRSDSNSHNRIAHPNAYISVFLSHSLHSYLVLLTFFFFFPLPFSLNKWNLLIS